MTILSLGDIYFLLRLFCSKLLYSLLSFLFHLFNFLFFKLLHIADGNGLLHYNLKVVIVGYILDVDGLFLLHSKEYPFWWMLWWILNVFWDGLLFSWVLSWFLLESMEILIPICFVRYLGDGRCLLVRDSTAIFLLLLLCLAIFLLGRRHIPSF